MYRNNHKKRFKSAILLVMFFIVILVIRSNSHQERNSDIVLGTMTIDAGDYTRINTPVRFQCWASDIFGDPDKFRREGFFHYIGDAADLSLLRDYHLVLVEEGGAKTRINVQWNADSGFSWTLVSGKGALVWILEGKTPKETKRTFKLVLEKGPAPSSPLSVEDIDDKHLLIKHRDKPVFRYNYEVIHQKEGFSDITDRAAYIHPVWTPSGKVITEDFSPEHTHQKGIFNAWVKLKFGDLVTDFWNLHKEMGKKLPDDLGPSVQEGPVFSQLNIYNKGVYKENTLMQEICNIKSYALPEENGWLFDIYLRQMPVGSRRAQRTPEMTTTATIIADRKIKRVEDNRFQYDVRDGKLIKGGYGRVGSSASMELLQCYYGGMAFRGIEDWRSENVSLDVLTSEGKTRSDGNGTEARWIDYTGPLGNEWGGIVIFDHPLNQRYPTSVRIHPELPYFCYAFTNNEPYTVAPGNTLNLVYRFLIHNGRPDKELNERTANDFVNPPEIKWEALNL